MICSVCRRVIPDGCSFCGACGARIANPAASPARTAGAGGLKLSKNMLREPSGEVRLERTAVRQTPAPARRRVLPGATVQPKWPPEGIDKLPEKKKRKKSGS